MRGFGGFFGPAFPNGGTKPYVSAQDGAGAISTNLFSTAVTLTEGTSVTCKGDDLANQTNKTMLLDELRFESQYRSALAVAAGITGVPIPGMFISAKLQVGRFLVIPRPTPLSLFCKPHDRIINGAVIVSGIESGALVFRLKKPIVMRQNDYLQLTLSYGTPITPTGSTVTFPVQVTGVGRLVNEAPSQEYLPYVGAYVPPFLTATFTTQQLIESFSSDLMNPNSEPLLVDHLLGQGQVVQSAQTNPIYDLSNYRGLDVIGLGWNGTQIQIISAGDRDDASHENFGIRDFQPFFHVFPPRDRAWNFKATLKPQSYLQVRELLTNWQNLCGLPADFYVRFPIGMVGYYKVTPRMAQTYGRHMPGSY